MTISDRMNHLRAAIGGNPRSFAPTIVQRAPVIEGNAATGIITTGGQIASGPRPGTRQQLQAYNDMPWLHAVVSKTSMAQAMTTWRTFVVRSVEDGKAIAVPRDFKAYDRETRAAAFRHYQRAAEFELVELPTHPMLDFINAGNSFFSGVTARQLTALYEDVVGESFAIMLRNGAGMPSSYFLLPPDWISRLPTPANNTYEIKFRSQRLDIDADDVLHDYIPDPTDPYKRGVGFARVVADELETDEYAAKYLKRLFQNSARPDFIVSIENGGDDDIKRLESWWRDKFGGFMRAFRPAFVNRKINLEQLSFDNSELQMIDLRKSERDIVLQTYGMPPEMMGILESSNRATIEAADLMFSRYVLTPRLERKRGFVQERLVPEFDDRLIVEYDSPVAEDREFNQTAMQATPWAYHVDEHRALTGHEPLPDDAGQVFPRPFNLEFSTTLEGFGTPPGPPDQPPDDDQETGDVADDDDDAKALDKPGDKIGTKVGDKPTPAEIADALLDDFDGDSMGNIRGVMSQTVEHFGEQLLQDADIDIAFDLSDPNVTSFLDSEGAKLVTRTTKTTKAALRSTLIEGLEAGETTDELVKRIRGTMNNASATRAHTIARTETVKASNFGSHAAMEQAGVERKQWLATADGSVRDSHASLNGQVKKRNTRFVVPINGRSAMHPGAFGIAEEDINCRCGIVVQLGDKTFTDEERAFRWKVFEAERMPFERSARRVARAAFKQQGEDFAEVVRRSNLT